MQEGRDFDTYGMFVSQMNKMCQITKIRNVNLLRKTTIYLRPKNLEISFLINIKNSLCPKKTQFYS